MTHKILVVDDEREIREELIEYLSGKGYDCLEASGVSPAMESLHEDPEIAIVITDIKMPGQDGLDLLSAIKSELEREVEVIVVTGHGGLAEATRALRLGASDFIEKPIDLGYLLHVTERADQLLHLRRAERLSRDSLKAEVEAKTLEVRKLLTSLERAYAESLDCLADAAEYKDPETGQHIRRMGAYARFLSGRLGWSEKRRDIIALAAPLHDVGKIGTPDAVLLKPGKLTPEEVVVMKRHAEIGYRVLSRSQHPVMKCAANIAWAHHERWDGGGYPRGLKGTDIPSEARIVMFGDVYDALRSERPYKPAFDHDRAVRIILDGDGRTEPEHFDPELLQIFRAHADKFARIFERLTG